MMNPRKPIADGSPSKNTREGFPSRKAIDFSKMDSFCHFSKISFATFGRFKPLYSLYLSFMRIFLVRWQIYDKSLIIYQALDELDSWSNPN